MKKVLVFMMACLASTVMFGQQVATHYQINKEGCGPMTTKITCVLAIEGVVQQNKNLEIGTFDQDGICRGAIVGQQLPQQFGGAVIFQTANFGFEGVRYPTFKVYDHANETELDLVFDIGDGIVWGSTTYTELYYMGNVTIGSALNPVTFNFVSPAAEGITKEIVAYDGETDGNWYLIASPVGEVDPTLVDNMTEYEYDLYAFDQSQDLEWLNHKGDEELEYEGGFSLELGKGYLYANDGGELDTITLTFPGTALPTEDTTITLSKVSGAEFEGWNLVGNPYNATGYIQDNRSFYRMNEERTELMAEAVTGGINPMEGVFVMAETDGEEMTFTTTAPNRGAMLALNVSRDSKVVDRAMVSFSGDRTLPKFQLNPSHTKVYIPQDNRDYAVVTAGEMGEMPVSFKAEKNGSYTLNFTAQEVSFAYLHLIDNKTGKDVDLLEAPAYSFDAQTSDYASRFKLVFATGNSTEDNFAFCSNGNWIISNDGEATLQVVDVNGRIMSEETVSGCVSKNISAAPGVYMLRLINGDNVKVQKIIVK